MTSFTSIEVALFMLFGFGVGVVVGYGMLYLEYQPFIGYLKSVRQERKMKEKIKIEWCKNTFCPDCPDSDTCLESKR